MLNLKVIKDKRIRSNTAIFLLEVDSNKFTFIFTLDKIVSIQEGCEFENMEDIEVGLLNYGLGLTIIKHK